MFRVTVNCEGISPAEWREALADVAAEFKSRPWHKIRDCHWDRNALVFVSDSDYDRYGEALADEFSDTVAAYGRGTPGYRGFTLMDAPTSESGG